MAKIVSVTSVGRVRNETGEAPVVPRKHSVPAIEPLGLSVLEAAAALGVSRAEAYRLLASGGLLAVKHGKRTIVTVASVHDYFHQLPRAEFRTPAAA